MSKPLEECSREELVEIIKCQKETIARTKKFGLVWEDKPEKVATDCTKKLPIIREVAGKVIDKGGDLEPTNIIIEGDNYHALSVLNYTHAGKIDVIYIDPPYNTGARDWKYNNDYVDSEDLYRHSKWLSMMDKRLRLAKKLLNPNDSVLICTIDEKEFTHLGCLLESIFAEAHIQMVSINIHPGGVARTNEFARSDEYAFIVYMGSASPASLQLGEEWLFGIETTSRNGVHWRGLLRSGSNDSRRRSPNCFYPIFVSADGKKIESVGEPLPLEQSRDTIDVPSGQKAIFPIHANGTEGCWQYSKKKLLWAISQGYVRLGGFTNRGMSINYLADGEQKKVESGLFKIIGKNEDGSLQLDDSGYQARFIPTTQWCIKSHDALRNGSGLIKKIFKDKRFNYPKSLYAVCDTINFFVANKPNAVILDFFAGSGTTLHAVNLLNKIDGGSRTCIMATNNEVSEIEAKALKAKGLKPGDDEWEKYGIAQYVTYPRTKCTIFGCDIDNKPLDGNYLGSDIPMADGFKSNVRYFKTAFVSKKGTLDKLRREMSPACEDMIRVREGAYEKVIDEEMLKVFKNSRGLTAIIYDRFELAEHIAKIEELETDAPVHLYVFSYSKSDRADEMPENLRHEYETQPIPEGVLEIYKKIFANVKGAKND